MTARAALLPATVLVFLLGCSDSTPLPSPGHDGGTDVHPGGDARPVGDAPGQGDARPAPDASAADGAPACTAPNPALQCRAPNQCLPSSCTCSNGQWVCTRDCGGGRTCPDAGPAPDAARDTAPACPGPNPAQVCRTSADQCLPSACGCSPEGQWVCTADCGGGRICADAGTPASVVWPRDASKLVATERGGFRPPPASGSECSPAVDGSRYALAVAGRHLEWQRCDPGPAGPYVRRTGARALTAAEYARVDTAMSQLRVVTSGPCGADKPLLTVTVTSPAGEHEYRDAFYVCQDRTKTYVTGIDAVFQALRDLAR